MVEISSPCSFQQCQPLLPPTLPPTVLPPVGFLWTLEGKWNPERLFRIAPTTHPVSKITPADVCSYPISTQALASHLFSIPKETLLQLLPYAVRTILSCTQVSFLISFYVIKPRGTWRLKPLVPHPLCHPPPGHWKRIDTMGSENPFNSHFFILYSGNISLSFAALVFFCSFPFLCCADPQQILKCYPLAKQKDLSHDAKLTSCWAFRPFPLWNSSRIYHFRDMNSCL